MSATWLTWPGVGGRARGVGLGVGVRVRVSGRCEMAVRVVGVVGHRVMARATGVRVGVGAKVRVSGGPRRWRGGARPPVSASL